MNTVQIQPVTIIDKTATQLSAYVIHYDLNAQNCILYWSLSDTEGASLYASNWSVPADVLSQWGTNDDVIMQALAASQNFIIVPDPVVPDVVTDPNV